MNIYKVSQYGKKNYLVIADTPESAVSEWRRLSRTKRIDAVDVVVEYVRSRY